VSCEDEGEDEDTFESRRYARVEDVGFSGLTVYGRARHEEVRSWKKVLYLKRRPVWEAGPGGCTIILEIRVEFGTRLWPPSCDPVLPLSW